MDWLPSILAALLTVVAVLVVRSVEGRIWKSDASEQLFRKQIYTFAVLFVGMLVIIFLLPEGSNQDLAFGVIGLVVTGALAISSQSIIANGMAGLLLRSLKKFRPGDFIEVGSSLGRVTELGLFHTEIQTNDRDLTTIPNALMVNQPVKVVRASGTIVSANVSLGYDVSRHTLRPLFIEASERAELTEPIVQVVELGDYSVVYRIGGFLDKPDQLLAARSKLRGAILDCLHEADVEIMSPMFVATRNTDGEVLVPAPTGRPGAAAEPEPEENRVFDKADIAGSIESHRKEIAACQAELQELQSQKGQAGVEDEAIRQKIAAKERRLERLAAELQEMEGTLKAE